MDMISPGLAGHRGLRGDILVFLKKAQPLTAKELADKFAVSANAVRRHLKELEAEGLAEYVREQRGNGAPTYSFRLTAEGEGIFPNRYEDALRRLLDHVVAHEGRDAAVSVVGQEYSDLRAKMSGNLEGKEPEERLRVIAAAFKDAGFMAECDSANGKLVLRIHNCALRAAVSCLPEVCDQELNFLKDTFGAELERGSHIIDGCNSCEYVVLTNEAKEAETV